MDERSNGGFNGFVGSSHINTTFLVLFADLSALGP